MGAMNALDDSAAAGDAAQRCAGVEVCRPPPPCVDVRCRRRLSRRIPAGAGD